MERDLSEFMRQMYIAEIYGYELCFFAIDDVSISSVSFKQQASKTR